MRGKKTKRNWWELRGDPNPPPEYEECYLRALRRMAVTLNCDSRQNSPFSPTLLGKSDPELTNVLARRKIGKVDANAALVNHELITRGQEPEDFDQAENLFYGDF